MEPRVKRASAKVQDIAAVATGIVLVLMLFMIAGNTLLRYGFNASWNFAEEYTAYGLIFMTFIPLGWTLKERGHIAIEIVVDKLSSKVSRWVVCIAGATSLIVAVTMLYYALRLKLASVEKGVHANTYMLTPIWIPQSFIVVGLFLFAVEIALYIADCARKGDTLTTETEDATTHG